jgi:hypothetical protein
VLFEAPELRGERISVDAAWARRRVERLDAATQ